MCVPFAGCLSGSIDALEELKAVTFGYGSANSLRPTGASVTRKAIFRRGKNILKTKIFRDVTTVLNERENLKIVFRSVPDSVILFLDRCYRQGLTALHLQLQFEIEVGMDLFQKLVKLAGMGSGHQSGALIYTTSSPMQYRRAWLVSVL
jgi:hypothetical protein